MTFMAFIVICNQAFLAFLAFIGICNPDALNRRIFNPIIALQMLIINAAGFQIRPNERTK